MSLARHCNGPDCDTWQRTDSDMAQRWYTLTDEASGDVWHFCEPWCLFRWASFAEPPEIVGEQR